MHAIDIRALHKTYANGTEALKGIDLTVQTGDFFALLGANGAGKSTVIGLLSTLLTKTSGHISISGHDLEQHTARAKASLGVVPQEFNLNFFESCENILFNQAGYYGLSRQSAAPHITARLKQLGLLDKRTTRVNQLSGGMKRRLMIARALVHQPRVLLLDEPTAGVDIEIRRSMWDFLRQLNTDGTTIVLTTHYLEEAEQLCKHIAILDKGRIIERTSMQALLASRGHQTYIFNTIDPIDILPALHPFVGIQLDHYTFELRMDNTQTLNEVLAVLSQQGLRIHSMRNKTNRLEELFMDLIHASD